MYYWTLIVHLVIRVIVKMCTNEVKFLVDTQEDYLISSQQEITILHYF